ncbi:MAG: NAD(P)/FAD-dependent oxidoreductase [Thermomicrobiales bacterium]
MQFDAIVIGASFAGVSAAMQLARARRSVCVIDSGLPRNRFAAAAHGIYGQDGVAPAQITAQARAQLLAYPTVTFIEGEAITARQDGPEQFSIGLASGDIHSAKRIVLAHGVTDVLPEIAGISERWGISVLHCPYCHGFEYAGQRLGVLRVMPGSLHQALLISEWGPTTYFLNGVEDLDEADRLELQRRNIVVEPTPIAKLFGPTPHLSGIHLTDSRAIALDALFLAPSTRLAPLAEQLGCDFEEGPTGLYLRTDPTKMTSIPNVYAAGDAATQMWNATLATADGVMAGVSVHRSLVFG